KGRTDVASSIYEQRLFHGATFGDLQRRNGPLILINATDLGGGSRFTFVQEYFDLICSDIATYPISRAVTASSAVPVMLNPVVLKHHSGCPPPPENYLKEFDEDYLPKAPPPPQLHATNQLLHSYPNHDQRQYI